MLLTNKSSRVITLRVLDQVIPMVPNKNVPIDDSLQEELENIPLFVDYVAKKLIVASGTKEPTVKELFQSGSSASSEPSTTESDNKGKDDQPPVTVPDPDPDPDTKVDVKTGSDGGNSTPSNPPIFVYSTAENFVAMTFLEIKKVISELSLAELKEVLSAEEAKDKPRTKLVGMLNKLIAEKGDKGDDK